MPTEALEGYDKFTDIRLSVENSADLAHVFAEHKPERVVHPGGPGRCSLLALENPQAYIDANIVRFI